MFIEELLGDLAKRVAAGARRDFLQASLRARIATLGDELACRIACLSRFGERHAGICAERQRLLLAGEAIGEPPQLGAGRPHEKIKAIEVAEFVFALLRLRLANAGVVEHVLVSWNKPGFETNKNTNRPTGCQRIAVDNLDR